MCDIPNFVKFSYLCKSVNKFKSYGVLSSNSWRNYHYNMISNLYRLSWHWFSVGDQFIICDRLCQDCILVQFLLDKHFRPNESYGDFNGYKLHPQSSCIVAQGIMLVYSGQYMLTKIRRCHGVHYYIDSLRARTMLEPSPWKELYCKCPIVSELHILDNFSAFWKQPFDGHCQLGRWDDLWWSPSNWTASLLSIKRQSSMAGMYTSFLEVVEISQKYQDLHLD
jgi:hypothetical protein